MAQALRGRPISDGRRPGCPIHEDGRVVFFGFRKTADGIYVRPRYRCEAPDGSTHYFTDSAQSRTHVHPAGTRCSECGRDQALREGLAVAHNWDFEARLIAEALVAVGRGASYRDAAEGMRMAAYRFQRDPSGIAYTSRAGETVARYIDHFASLVLAKIEHREWPSVLILDALPLRRRETMEDDPLSWELEGNGAILFALGYTAQMPRRTRKRSDQPPHSERPPRPKRLPHLWKVAVAGGLDRSSWLEFLHSLPGTPDWVVVDGDSAVRYAVQARWGHEPVIYSCEGHLKRGFQKRARDQDHLPGIEIWNLWPDYKRELPEMTRGPLWTPDDYRRFLDALLAYRPDEIPNVTSWIAHHDSLIRRQFDLRRPGYPRGIGALEAAIDKIDGWIGERRRTFQNVRRLNLTLGLMRAQIAGHANAAQYAEVIRAALERTGGRPTLDWREHHNRNGAKGLFALADEARAVAEATRQEYWVTAQAGTLSRKAAIVNAYHAAYGYPPIELTAARTPAVRVAGKTVADFPLVAREWDAINDGDPASTPAGRRTEVDWICYADPSHRWSASINQRCSRLSGCPDCGRVRGIASVNKQRKHDLAKIRAAWGDYDETEAPQTEPQEGEALEVSGVDVA